MAKCSIIFCRSVSETSVRVSARCELADAMAQQRSRAIAELAAPKGASMTMQVDARARRVMSMEGGSYAEKRARSERDGVEGVDRGKDKKEWEVGDGVETAAGGREGSATVESDECDKQREGG